MGGFKILILCFATWVGTATFAEEPPVFGTYQGILRHHRLGVDQRASLELIFDRKNGESLEITGILKAYFGAPHKGEYVSYVFNAVRYNVITGTLAFDQADQGLTIVVSSFKGGRMEGRVRAPLLGTATATLILSHSDRVVPELPLLREISGVYRGNDGLLDLKAFRSSEERPAGGFSPFGENEIRGHLGRVNPELGGLIVDSTFTQASYDFFKGRLTLFGNLEALTCLVRIDALVCEGEVFRRELGAEVAEQAPFVPLWKTAWEEDIQENPSAPQALSGQYWGYVHHEMRDQYQPAGLNIVALPAISDEGFQISAIASLHFGDVDGEEALSYKYEPKTYPLISRQLVLKRPENDAIIQVRSWRNGILRGVWHSRSFGRVGTFELRKDGYRSLPPGTLTMPSLSGVRDSGFWRMQLKVARRPGTITSANPFSPLHFGGFFWDSQRVVIPKSTLQGGSYDFFTGKIFLPITVTGESLYLSGEHDTRGDLHLSLHLSNRFGAVYAPQQISFSSVIGDSK